MKIDQIFSDYNSLGMPGAAVMIIQDGTPILQKGFGMADLKQGLPVTPKTNFRLASITKQFTAMSILQLVERGNLSLDTTLLDIFSEFPDYGKIITIKDLLHHTSGLYDYEGLEPKGQVRQLKDKDVLTSMMSMEGAYFPAGEKHRYSNTAYAALTQIIEKETGLASERATIAGVFVRRLQKGMKLQTDPTVIYGMGEDFKGNIRRTDLTTDTPYNTYVHKGLPPTPIALPGRAAIEAALHPEEGLSLFFVSKGDGSHAFSDTYPQHLNNVRKYQLNQ